MADVPEPTYFLPAKRLPQAAVERIAADIAHSPSALTLAAIPLAVVIVNDTRQIVYANARFASLALQADPAAVIGQRIGEALGCEHVEDNPGGCGTTRFCQYCGAAQAIVKSLEGGQGTQECSINRVSPTTLEALNLQVWAMPIAIEGHELVLNSILDIAHEKALRGFERIFFHDIINAVTGIKGISDLLSLELPGKYVSELELLRRSIDDLQDVVDTQRDFLAVEAKEYQQSFTRLYTLDILNYLSVYCQSFNHGGKRRLEIAPQAAAALFSSDLRLVQRIMVNMIKNALEASSPGDTVTLGADAAPGEVRLWVQNLQFMPEEVQMHLFEKGFSTKGEGRGLGAYSMRLFARQCLHGDIAFTSSPEDGTRFNLVLSA
jgi:signal transduction histidine kinase